MQQNMRNDLKTTPNTLNSSFCFTDWNKLYFIAEVKSISCHLILYHYHSEKNGQNIQNGQIYTRKWCFFYI